MNSKFPLKIMIGFDQSESVAMHVLIHSILARASKPVSITPIYLNNIRDVYTKQRDPKQSNEFSFTRFLTPYLSNYEGWSLFLDCDMMLRTDIAELFELADPDKAVMVVKHHYTPTTDRKYLGAVQYRYPRKNWSSVMLFNNSKCKALTPEYVNHASAMELHRFAWTEDALIGALPLEWNHLVSEYPPNKNAKIVHWTIGGPYFKEYQDVEFADQWRTEYQSMVHCTQMQDVIT